jgi:fatty-acyl-CoA synthase
MLCRSRNLRRLFSAAEPMSYFSGKGQIDLLYKTISQQLRDTAAKFPNRPAAFSYHENIELTYRQLLERVEHMAAGLLALDLSPQARVGVFAPTVIDYYVIQLACSMADLVLVNINPAYRLHELEYAINKVGCEVIFIVSQVKTTNYEKLINDLCPELSTSKVGKINCASVPSLKYVLKLDHKASQGFMVSDELLKLGSKSDNLKAMREAEGRIQSEDLTNIQFTSGTTGSPKASCLSHFNILNNGNILAKHIKYTEKDKILCSVPLYHCFGMVMCNLAALCSGAEVLYPHMTFDAIAGLKVASERKATSLYGVPTMFIENISQVEKNPGKFDLSSVRGGVMAGSICPRPLMEKAREILNCKELIIGYGMTETSPLSFLTSSTDPVELQVSTVGKVLPNTECKLLDEQGRVVPLGQRGEICTRGYCVMKEYWGDHRATNASIDANGWMHTGDVGIFDKDGYLSIVGRVKDMINRGGEKVFPKEIEEYLLRHPKVLNVQVFAYPDERLGEEIFCWIKLKEGQSMEKKEVLDYCKEQIAHYKIPRYLKFVNDFPITVTGKPQKFKMTESMVEEVKANPKVIESYRLR